ncbi:MAG: TIGR03905 family TSCPD domain-containing protein [Clostridia bacterium]|nr:TIGR03905 family TSCPD domain-containing protein [Clostridia bacterium]
MQYTYTPKGVCSKQMIIDIDDATDTVKFVKIVGGCPGNTIGVSKLVEGKKLDEVIELLKGIPCGYRGTSCPDQLAIALEEIKNAR